MQSDNGNSNPLNDGEQMQAIPIDELLLRKELPIDVYVLLPTGRYLLVGKRDTPSEPVKRYKLRDVNMLYVRTADYHEFVRSTVEEATVLVNAEWVSNDQRVEGVRNAMAAVHHEIATLGFDDQVLGRAKTVSSATLSVISKSPKLVDLLAKLGDLSNDNTRHSMSVSVIASMLGVAQGWVKPGTIEKLALIGFLHDVGKTALPPDLINKRPEALTGDDLIIYQSHPESGAQLLAQAKSVPDDVILAVKEHHELADGSGFPEGKRDLLLSPLARVISLADAFVTMVDEDPKRMTAEKAREAVEKLTFHKAHLYNRDALKALHKLFPQVAKKAAG